MSDPAPQSIPASLQLVLANEEGIGHVLVDLEPFVAFNRSINRDLAELEQRFAHFQTPGVPTGRRDFKNRKPK